MAYDEALAQRIRGILAGQSGVSERNMFGVIAFFVNGNMAVGIVAGAEGSMMFRRDPDRDDPVDPHIGPQIMGGRVMSGWLRVDADGIQTDEQLREMVERGISYALKLPAK